MRSFIRSGVFFAVLWGGCLPDQGVSRRGLDTDPPWDTDKTRNGTPTPTGVFLGSVTPGAGPNEEPPKPTEPETPPTTPTPEEPSCVAPNILIRHYAQNDRFVMGVGRGLGYGEPIQILDVENPEDPLKAFGTFTNEEFNGTGAAYSATRDIFAAIGDAGFEARLVVRFIRVNEGYNAEVLSTFSLADHVDGSGEFSSDGRYFFLSALRDAEPRGYLRVIDLLDARSPREVASSTQPFLKSPTSPRYAWSPEDVAANIVRGDATTLYGSGVADIKRIDISDPIHPVITTSVWVQAMDHDRTPGTTDNGMAVRDGALHLSRDRGGNDQIFTFSIAGSAPELTNIFEAGIDGGDLSSVAIHGAHLISYLGIEQNVILSLTDPLHPTLVGSLPEPLNETEVNATTAYIFVGSTMLTTWYTPVGIRIYRAPSLMSTTQIPYDNSCE